MENTVSGAKPQPIRLMEAHLSQPTAVSGAIYQHIRENAKHARRFVKHRSRTGKRVVICGAGPSLEEECRRLPEADEVWACNSALPYLMERGIKVTHAVTVDQNEAMLNPGEWDKAWPVTYLVASCIHPRLTGLLRRSNARMRWFHSYQGAADPPEWDAAKQGCSYEWHLYTTLYGDACQVGYGLNTAVRALCLAAFMDFSEMHIVGVDCACAPNSPRMPPHLTPEYAEWIKGLRFYADGRPASVYGEQEWLMQAEIDGVRWHTRADMALSARMLVNMAMADPRIRIIGNTLPNAFWPHRNDAEWMADLPNLDNGGRVTNIRLYTADELREAVA